MVELRSFSLLSTVIRSVGAKRANSFCQFITTEAGATTRDAPAEALYRMKAIVWTVLPRPMSSARQAPAPQCASLTIHRKPSTW